jgi:predicted adenine nucleotide alpha hydrolase (AANH) superfamily ATPase
MSCCAPCSAAAIKKLRAEGADFAVLFYNPNIFPRDEYDRRLAEQIKFCKYLGVKCFVGEYDHDAWLACVKGLEMEPERGRRCAECFRHRFQFGAKWAAEHGYDVMTSVFGVSPHKDQAQVDAAAKNSQFTMHNAQLKYIPFDFAYEPEAGMYRQKYCGCAPAFAGMTTEEDHGK